MDSAISASKMSGSCQDSASVKHPVESLTTQSKTAIIGGICYINIYLV